MDQLTLALPILPGKTEQAHTFLRKLREHRKRKRTNSQQRSGLVRVSWQLLHAPQGDLLMAYMESADLQEALRLLSQGQSHFERWFMRELLDITGASLGGSLALPHDEPPSPDEVKHARSAKQVKHLHV